ncbi:7TM diverse intracellular signaling domain-containing protein [Comamonas sp.]|uniref:sensor histidine kinase n=1 Tax=Comamonas sp. TaxID=34028 RepID=UPI003A8DE80C
MWTLILFPMARLAQHRLWVLMMALLLAVASPSVCAQPVLRLDAGSSISAAGYLELLRDPGGSMDADAADAAASWRALPGSVKLGYTDDAVWLRLSVQRGSEAPARWLLKFSNALLDDVRLYRRDHFGYWQLVQYSGEEQDRRLWPIDARNPVLPLQLDSAAPESLLLRVQTRNALTTRLEIATPELHGAESQRESLYYGLGLGFGLLLILFHALFWLKTRETVNAWYVAYVVLALQSEWLTSGLAQQTFGLPGWLSDYWLSLVLCAALPVGVFYSDMQLGLAQRMPRFSRGLIVVFTAIGLIAAMLVIAGDIGAGMLLMQISALVAMMIMIGTAIWMLRRDDDRARAFLLVFGIYYAGVMVSFLRNLGLVPNTVISQNAAALGTLVHMVVMSVRLSENYDRMRREKEAAQQRVVALVGQQNEQLEQEVFRRTEALRQEIGRREYLEAELRAALETERRTRQSQLDFIAMISHEFLTPLAIINTTAQQIARNIDAAREKTLARCENLRNAAKRMMALVDEYLSTDRMNTEHAPFQPRECSGEELRELLDELVSDWPEERVRLHDATIPERLWCDLQLMRVAVRNLLANADRHTASGLQFDLEVLRQSQSRIAFRVSNPGEEIPVEEVPCLFEKYFRGRQAQQSPGAGLGLYLVRRIAELHEGEVVLESFGQDKTVRFLVSIPV